MSDKVIVICVVLAMVAIIAIIFICRAMRYKKFLKAAVPKRRPRPETPTEEKPSFAELFKQNGPKVRALIDDALNKYFEANRDARSESDLESQDEPDKNNR